MQVTKEKREGYLSLWSLYCNCMVLRKWDQEGSTCL